jgi:hypothetical protein
VIIDYNEVAITGRTTQVCGSEVAMAGKTTLITCSSRSHCGFGEASSLTFSCGYLRWGWVMYILLLLLLLRSSAPTYLEGANVYYYNLRRLTLETLSSVHQQASGTAIGTGGNGLSWPRTAIHPFSRAERHPVKGHGCKGLPGSNLWEVGLMRMKVDKKRMG